MISPIAAQNVDTSFSIDLQNPVFKYDHGSLVGTTSDGYLDKYCRFSKDAGPIDYFQAPVFSGSDLNETQIKTAVGNYVVVMDWFDPSPSGGGTLAIYYIHPNTGIWTRIRTIRNASSVSEFSGVTSDGDLLLLMSFGTDSYLGNNLVGSTYGGDHGDSGPNLAPVSNGVLLIRVDSTGYVAQNDIVHFPGFDTQPVSVREIESGILVEMLFDDPNPINASYYLLLNKNQLAQTGFDPQIEWETPHYENATLTFGEINGEFIVNVKPFGPDNGYAQRFNSAYCLIEGDMEYSWISAGAPKRIFGTNQVIFFDQVAAGNDRIDFRYGKTFFPGNGYNDVQIVSVDTVTMIATIFGSYTGSGNYINGTALVDVPAGQTGIVFITLDLSDSGNKFTLDNSLPGVTESFAYVERVGNQVIPSDQHLAYMVADTAVLVAAIGLGNPMPNGEGVYPPAGAGPVYSMLEYDTINSWYYADYGAEIPTIGESQILRVIFTEDPLYEPAPAGSWVNPSDTIIVAATEDDQATGGCYGNNIVSYEIFSGDLPDGISINNATGDWEGGYNEDGVFNIVVLGIDSYNDSIYKNVQFQIDQNTVGLDDELASISPIVLYPNPAIDIVRFSHPFGSSLHAEVYSMSGKLVFSGQLSADQLSVSGFNSGIYIVKLSHEGKHIAELRLVKQ